MIIHSIKLHNIRSYIDQEIRFPKGSVLLSGDIGAGKSTILLSIEFALFGILPGNLEGESLLRNGKITGSVELSFSLEEKNIVVKRNLKRTKDAVRQDAGYLIIDNMKMDLTPSELKARILDMLGYPKDLISKSKSLIYRYTVYTHQEAMNQILFEQPDVRLDIFRRMFAVDRYRRISQNCTIILQNISEKRKILLAQTSDYEEKKAKKKLLEDKRKELAVSLAILIPKETALEIEISQKQAALTEAEREIQSLNHLRQKQSSLHSIIDEKNKQISYTQLEIRRNAEEINMLEKRKETQQNSLPVFLARVSALQTYMLSMQTDSHRKKEIMEELVALETDLVEYNGLIREAEFTINTSQKIQKQIIDLDNCPMCLQPVSLEHKGTIHGAELQKIETAKTILENHSTVKKESESRIKSLRAELERVHESEKRFARINAASESFISFINELGLSVESYADQNSKFDEQEIALLAGMQKQLKDLPYIKDMIIEQQKLKGHLLEKHETIKKDLLEYEKSLAEIKNSMITHSHAESFYQKTRLELAELQYKSKEISSQKAVLNKEVEYITNYIEEAEAELGKKMTMKEQLADLNQLHAWLSEYFVSLMGTIEKQVMMKLHAEFNELFQSWFSMLMESDVMSARLDETFSPVITQDGHEISSQNLSGGEKTSCALAYRLALNKVINDMISSIKTKELIILDEPTDGFSSEQLEKVRDVIRALQMAQIIIVSHEEKVESFVDSQLRITKTGHVSTLEN